MYESSKMHASTVVTKTQRSSYHGQVQPPQCKKITSVRIYRYIYGLIAESCLTEKKRLRPQLPYGRKQTETSVVQKGTSIG